MSDILLDTSAPAEAVEFIAQEIAPKTITAPNILRVSFTALAAEQLAEAIDGTKETYWEVHGFRTGRLDEWNKPPPIWQWRNRSAWRRGMRAGQAWAAR